MTDIFFFMFSGLMLLCGLLVIVSRNPVTSALFLVLSFGFLAGLYVLLEAFFLAAIQILVYAGAVMVLFLFVIMLLDIKASGKKQLAAVGGVGGVSVAVLFAMGLHRVLGSGSFAEGGFSREFTGSLKAVVRLLFTRYTLPFEVTGLLLLVAMIGVVLLSKKDLR